MSALLLAERLTMQLKTFFVERGHSCPPVWRGTAEADRNVGALGHGAGRSADILVRPFGVGRPKPTGMSALLEWPCSP